MPLNAKLVVVGGDVKTGEIKLRLPSTIGRGRGTTIMLAHPLVSRQHCELYEAEGQLMVRDLGSLNGTFVNNQRINEAPLPPGELLTIGTVTFRAVYDLEPGAATPKAKAPQTQTVSAKPAAAAASRASAPTPKPLSRPRKQEEEVEFSFDEALLPLDDGATPITEDVRDATQRLETTTPVGSGKGAEKKPTKSAPPAAKQAPAAAPAPAKTPPAPLETDSADLDVSKWTDDEEEQVDSAEDDDLDDFLKNLEK